MIVTCWSWLLSFKVTCSISLLSVDSKLHCYYCYYNYYYCSSLQPPTLLPRCEGRPSSLCFCSKIFTVHPMADCENCGVVVLGMRCWEKCGVIVVGLRCSKKIMVLHFRKKMLLWGCIAGKKIVVLLWWRCDAGEKL